MKHRLHITALLALSLAGTAQAASTVTAILSNFQLTTTGTVTPYLQNYRGDSGQEMGTMSALASAEIGYSYLTNTGALNWSTDQVEHVPVILDATQGQSPANWVSGPTASVSSGAKTAYAHVNADLSMIAAVSTGEDGGHALAAAVATQSFWLAANSSITVTWDATLRGSNSGENYALSYLNTATSAAGADAGGPAMQHYTIAHGDQKNAQGGFSFIKRDTSRTLTFQTTDSASLVYLRLEALATTHDHVTLAPPPPVPEPETWAMALIGLALMGANARRRLTR